LRALSPATVEVGGATVVLNPRDPVISGALSLGVYERAETKVFQRLCAPGAVFLDVGANVGYYTALAGKALGPHGRVIALEPDPESFFYLEKTVAANAGAPVQCFRKAAGEQAGEATLYTSADNRGDNRLYANELANGECKIEVVAVDELLEQLGIAELNLVKIDVQGYEGKVFAGMQRTLARSPQLSMMFEFWPEGLARAGSNAARLLANLTELGFTLQEITPQGELAPLHDQAALIERLKGRRYTNLVASKGAPLRPGPAHA